MKLLSTILVLLLSQASFGQQLSDKESIDKIMSHNIFFDRAANISAKNAFTEFIASHPTSDSRPFATFWLAEVYKKIGENDSAMACYQQVLNLPAVDNIDKDQRHRAAKSLAEIFIGRKEFDMAMNYIEAAANKYLPVNECGFAAAEDRMDMLCLSSSCYVGRGNYQKAIDSLSPYMFANLFAPNSKLVKLLFEIYSAVYSKKEIRDQFIRAAESLVIKKEQYPSFTYLHPMIKIFSYEVDIPLADPLRPQLTQEEQKQKCLDKIRHSEMYQLVMAD